MKKRSDNIKIVIVDDHRLFNDGLSGMLKSQAGIHVQAQVYDSREAEQVINQLNPDVVLIDFNMPHLNGIELTKLLLSKSKETKVLILSMYHEEMYIESFKRAGSKGYLFKTASVEDVVSAIHAVHSGTTHFPAMHKKSVHSEDLFLKKLKLSSRELEVIRLVKSGLKTKEIADKLNISFYTAETHRKNIKLKIGVEGETAFLKFVYEVELDE
jgi:DNA-binding NarL/FixJ family response regulator